MTASEKTKQWNKTNMARKKANDKAWREANPERKRDYERIWYNKNPHKKRIARAKYKAIHLKSTPKWLSKDHLILIEMYYKLAVYMTEVTGIKWEVDHIIPLQGQNVSGLHVPWNLRVITKAENASKCNKL